MLIQGVLNEHDCSIVIGGGYQVYVYVTSVKNMQKMVQ